MDQEDKAAAPEDDQQVDTGTDDQVEDQQDAGGGPDPEVEERARRMGWAPKEDFKGDPKRWVDAETFVQRGEEIMPILKANLRKLEADNAEIRETLRQFADHHTKTEQRMYQKAIREIQAAQRKAAEDGDLAQYDQLEQRKQAVVKEATQSAAPKQDGERVDPVAQEWAENNKWFATDKKMAAFATTHHELLLRTDPSLSLEENLEEVTRAVKKAFPEKFTNPRRNGHQAVEGNPASRRGSGKSYTDLPPEAKQACDRFVKQGLMKREEYVKDYFAE